MSRSHIIKLFSICSKSNGGGNSSQLKRRLGDILSLVKSLGQGHQHGSRKKIGLVQVCDPTCVKDGNEQSKVVSRGVEHLHGCDGPQTSLYQPSREDWMDLRSLLSFIHIIWGTARGCGFHAKPQIVDSIRKGISSGATPSCKCHIASQRNYELVEYLSSHSHCPNLSHAS